MTKQLGALVAGMLMVGAASAGGDSADFAKSLRAGAGQTMAPMSASASTVASRGFVSPSQPLYGGFSLASSATVYILVRGNSMNTLGITSNYLDAPRVRIFNQANQDLVIDANNNAGRNGCTASSAVAVASYYQGRGIPAHDRDFCYAAVFPAGAYTFTVNTSIAGVTTSGTNSSPASGEVLFEVSLGP
jgi:hypothetical protein